MELQPFNIRVSLVEPGFFRTGLHTSMAPSTQRIADYDDMRSAIETSLHNSVAKGGDPQRVAETIAEIAASKSPRLRTRVGPDAVWVPRLKAITPHTIFQTNLRRRFGLLSTEES